MISSGNGSNGGARGRVSSSSVASSLKNRAAPRPINLPSQKMSNKGLDPTIDIVPSGGTGWGIGPSPPSQASAISQIISSANPKPPAWSSTTPGKSQFFSTNEPVTDLPKRKTLVDIDGPCDWTRPVSPPPLISSKVNWSDQIKDDEELDFSRPPLLTCPVANTSDHSNRATPCRPGARPAVIRSADSFTKASPADVIQPRAAPQKILQKAHLVEQPPSQAQAVGQSSNEIPKESEPAISQEQLMKSMAIAAALRRKEEQQEAEKQRIARSQQKLAELNARSNAKKNASAKIVQIPDGEKPSVSIGSDESSAPVLRVMQRPKLVPTLTEQVEPARQIVQLAGENMQSAQKSSQPSRESVQPLRDAGQPAREVIQSPREAARPSREKTQSARGKIQPARERTQRAREKTQPARERMQSARESSQPARERSQPAREVLLSGQSYPAVAQEKHIRPRHTVERSTDRNWISTPIIAANSGAAGKKPRHFKQPAAAVAMITNALRPNKHLRTMQTNRSQPSVVDSVSSPESSRNSVRRKSVEPPVSTEDAPGAQNPKHPPRKPSRRRNKKMLPSVTEAIVPSAPIDPSPSTSFNANSEISSAEVVEQSITDRAVSSKVRPRANKNRPSRTLKSVSNAKPPGTASPPVQTFLDTRMTNETVSSFPRADGPCVEFRMEVQVQSVANIAPAIIWGSFPGVIDRPWSPEESPVRLFSEHVVVKRAPQRKCPPRSALAASIKSFEADSRTLRNVKSNADLLSIQQGNQSHRSRPRSGTGNLPSPAREH